VAVRESDGARITVIFPIYRAADAVDELVGSIARQEGPDGASAASGIEVIFIDNASPDDTVERLEQALERRSPAMQVRVVRNERNLGLARSFNRALGMVRTDYVLTCHADCRFGSDDYVARVVDLLDRNPDVAVVSGQSVADVEAGLSQVEKVYLAANLMDVFPEDDRYEELVPVGFAEGRCDGFRMEAIRRAGFYDTALRRAGEDQILSARLRALGYRVCKAPRLRYYLSVSSDQDSLTKLVRHAQLFGRVTPYLLLANRGTVRGIAGGEAGRNRTGRTALRALQLLGAAGWVIGSVELLRGAFPRRGAPILAATSALKIRLMSRYVRTLRFDLRDTAALIALQPLLDLAYATGVARGLALLALRRSDSIT
jgi:GT2 family glycosyltransferase